MIIIPNHNLFERFFHHSILVAKTSVFRLNVFAHKVGKLENKLN